MKILSWNIQYTKGSDKRFDLDRIIQEINTCGDIDVMCLQEVSRHIALYNGDDQKARLENVFAEYESAWAPCFSLPLPNGTRQEFGNLTLVKKPLLWDQRQHTLPNPYIFPTPQMPRTMVETVIGYQEQAITLFNTHLAFHSDIEAHKQMQHLTALRDQLLSHVNKVNISRNPNEIDIYHAATKGQHVILCGDLNIPFNSPMYDTMINELGWCDSVIALEEKVSHITDRPPTCGIYDNHAWPQGPHTRDYFLCSHGLKENISSYQVNTVTNASDHQPICLTLK